MHKILKGKAACAALSGLLVLSLLGSGCGNKNEGSTASTETGATKTTTGVPANAPPQAQESIRSSQAMGNAMNERARAQGAAMQNAARR